MKRKNREDEDEDEDADIGSQLKRTASSSNEEPSRHPQTIEGARGQVFPTDDAISYLKAVKYIFQDGSDKYDEFIKVMKDFKAQRIDTTGVIATIKELFKGNRDLILGFNTFLPKGYEITLPFEDDILLKKPVELEEAINFVNKIKMQTRFQNDDCVYIQFLEILNMYRKEKKTITEVYQEVAILFCDHRDLLDEFTHFLPEASTLLRLTHRDTERGMTSHAERDLTVDHSDAKKSSSLKMDEEQRRLTERDNERKEDKDWRDCDLDDKDLDDENTRDFNVQHLAQKQQSARTAGDPFFRRPYQGVYNEEFTFCEKVKEKLSNSEDYRQFLSYLCIYSTQINSRSELQTLMKGLLEKHPELMAGFNEFLTRCEKPDGFLASVMSKKSMWNDGDSPRAMTGDNKDRDWEYGRDKNDCGTDRFDKDVAFASHKGIYSNRDKHIPKPISELDLSNCERCTPSYRLLPENYSMPVTSQRSKLAAEVLNDCWVSVTSGSEDYSFKHMRKNQYEESLFRCEDDRFELDMLIESVEVTTKRAEEFLVKINDDTIKLDSQIRMEDHFKAIHLRCIERIYGVHGLDVTDALRKNAAASLPVILSRLKQKREEWVRCRSDFNKVWAEIYAKNHQKSLDHCSFYFKQQDKKSLSSIGEPPRKQGADDTEDAGKVKNHEVNSRKAESDGPAAEVAITDRPNSSCNGASNVLVEHACSLRPRLVNGNTAKGNCHSSDRRAHKIDSFCSSPQHGKAQNGVCKADDMLRARKDANSVERLTDSNASRELREEHIEVDVSSSGISTTPARIHHTVIGVGLEPRLNNEALLSKEGSNSTRTPLYANGVLEEGTTRRNCMLKFSEWRFGRGPLSDLW